MSTFERGTTIRFRLIVKDFDGNIVAPTETPTCTIFDADTNTPIATLAVTSYGTGLFQGRWKIPNDTPVSVVRTIKCPKCYTIITISEDKYKTCYAEWSWVWNGDTFIERVSFKVVIVD